MSSGDPRIYFAAERTLLAWLRTACTAFSLGFVIAKFGLFLRYIAPRDMPAPTHKPGLSLIIGVGMVLLGAVACLIATLDFRRFVASIALDDRPIGHSSNLIGIMSFAFAAAGLLLAVYLLL